MERVAGQRAWAWPRGLWSCLPLQSDLGGGGLARVGEITETAWEPGRGDQDPGVPILNASSRRSLLSSEAGVLETRLRLPGGLAGDALWFGGGEGRRAGLTIL